MTAQLYDLILSFAKQNKVSFSDAQIQLFQKYYELLLKYQDENTAVQKKFTNPKATLTVQNFLMV